MATDEYFGTYAQFETASKQEGAKLTGADNLVGDVFTIEFVVEDGQRVAWMKNRFGALVGFFDEETSRQLSLCEARGWVLQALLAYVAYSDSPDQSQYWGEAALICFSPAYTEAFDVFTHMVADRLINGVRPLVDLGAQGVNQIISTDGAWFPKKTLLALPKNPGTVYIKTKRSINEKLIEQGRAGNKGCYVGTIILVAVILAALVFLLRSCGLF